MKLLKILKKLQPSIFLFTIILFSSCSIPNDDTIDEQNLNVKQSQFDDKLNHSKVPDPCGNIMPEIEVTSIEAPNGNCWYTLTFHNLNQFGNVNYEWLPNDSAVPTGNQNQPLNILLTNNYPQLVVTLTVSNANTGESCAFASVTLFDCQEVIEECEDPCNINPDFSDPNDNGDGTYTFSPSQSVTNNPCSDNYSYAWGIWGSQTSSYSETWTVSLKPGNHLICLSVEYDTECKENICKWINIQ